MNDISKMKRVARFQPQRTDDLRPEVKSLVGRTLEFSFAGTGGEDEPYPGETRWMVIRRVDDGPELIESELYWWSPERDLEELPA